MDQYFYIKNPWWENKRFEPGIPRRGYIDKIFKSFDQKLLQVLTGLRRVGKSTLILQTIRHAIHRKKVNPKRILYFSADEPSLKTRAIIDIINEFRAELDIKIRHRIFVFIDEIQLRDNWEQEIKSLYDSENIKFVLTGSSALLLSEKISLLTGRYLKIQVKPLNFREYLKFRGKKVSKSNRHLLVKYSEEYLRDGGMPEYILDSPDRYLQTTIESILFKDLVSKFKLRNPEILLELILLLSDRVGSRSSSLKLAKILETNKDTILSYLNHLKLVFITSELDNYSTSRNKQIYNPAKIYFEDNGILNAYTSKTNIGILAENTLYNYLKTYTQDKDRVKLGYWYEGKNEIDFILDINNEKFLFESKWINASHEIDFKPLRKVFSRERISKTFYITRRCEDTIEVVGRKVQLIPLYKLLLGDLEKYL